MTDRLKISGDDSGGSSPPTYYRAAPAAEVDINCRESLDKWAQILHLSHTDLIKAVEEFGPVIKDIRRGLRKKRNEAA